MVSKALALYPLQKKSLKTQPLYLQSKSLLLFMQWVYLEQSNAIDRVIREPFMIVKLNRN